MLKFIFRGLEFFWSTLIYLIYPPMCPICREITDEQFQFCDKCREKFFRADKIKNPRQPIAEVMRLTTYRGGTQKMLNKLKFENNQNVLPYLKNILAESSKREEVREFIKKIDAAMFVPLHESRLKERGYNQVELIFKDWLDSQNVPIENFLIRHKQTPKLYNLNPKEREETLNNAFIPRENFNLTGKKILIVDDIYTTGATSSECAKVLKSLGADKIFMLALASDFKI